ncbi:MAG: type II toxin-antitoxin system RelE/ParE family toxin [Bacteroidales bacterium]
MREYLDILLADEVEEFLDEIDEKARDKIIYNIDKAKYSLDPKIFKKLTKEIWEFRTKYKSTQSRLLSFWDSRDNKDTLVIATHVFIKKTQKTPKSEIDRAIKIREFYFSKNK